MNTNLTCLCTACDSLGISYSAHHPRANLLEVHTTPPLFFSNWATPLNPQSTANICTDKDYCYQLLKTHIAMPKSRSFFDPLADEKYNHYKSHNSLEDIAKEILSSFSLPLCLKRNRGSHGSHVFCCETEPDVLTNLTAIFNHDDREYDYVCVAQEWIDTAHEYRVIVLDGTVQFAYEKDVSQAVCTGNLSPLHWENAKALQIDDQNKIDSIQSFLTPFFSHFPLIYGGIDILETPDGTLYFLEANASPSFACFVRDNGEGEVVELYKKILQRK